MRLPPWLWRTLKSKWSKRLLIASPFLLTTAIVSFYGIANWWGARALRWEIAAMRGDGLPVTFEERFGPLPPTIEDVFQHPAIRAELEKQDGTDLKNLGGMSISGLKKSRDWEPKPDLGKLGDVRLLADPPQTSKAETEVAREILVLIETRSREFDACVEGLSRPACHWGLNKNELPSRCLRLLKLMQFTVDRARLHLVAGHSDFAAQDLKTAMEIRSRLAGPKSSFIAFVCAVFGERDIARAVWEGVARRAWSEPQLADFQSQLEKVNFRRALHEAAPTEWIYMKAVLEELPAGYLEGREWEEIGPDFFEAGKNRDTAEMKRLAVEAWDKAKPLGLKMRETVQDMSRMREWYLRFQRSHRIPEISDFNEWDFFESTKGLTHAIRAVQTQRDLLMCGIALERYRLRYGRFSERLDQLVPEFLPEVPKDICDGQPLRYQLLPDGAPHVWSLWPSGKDEGGMPNDSQKKGNAVWTTGNIPGLTEAAYKTR
jgi:hypothetical protein